MAYSILPNKCNGCSACLKICPVGAITGDSKKAHVISVEACIECGACGLVCARKAVLDPHGKECVPVKKKDRKRPRIALELCTACTVCVAACPVNCLEMSSVRRADFPDAYPCLRADATCISCGFCASACPVDAIELA